MERATRHQQAKEKTKQNQLKHPWKCGQQFNNSDGADADRSNTHVSQWKKSKATLRIRRDRKSVV